MFYLNLFFIYSFLGFLFESIFTMIMGTNFNSGILYGPWTFIYAFGIFGIMLFNKFLNKFDLKKWLEVFIFFIGSAFMMSVIELSGGFLIEKLFHVVYWDYSYMTFNIGSYICLEAALFWGLFATLVNYFVAPKLDNLAKKVPVYITVIFMALFVVDIVATIIY